MDSDAFRLEKTLTYQLHQLARLIDRRVDYSDIQRIALNAGEGRTIAVLGYYGTLSVIQLARLANLDKSQASRAVVSLVEKGIIEKRSDSRDARAFELFLTPAGQSVYTDIVDLIVQRNEVALKSLTPREKQTLFGLFSKIHQNLTD
ncbi:MAG TPA: MarR family winged helix-turn-helix transcriptional regulator [Advenella sp.]|nr:MarR family winged helix-turn-helix transcriptional regulator [Advenella sp.]